MALYIGQAPIIQQILQADIHNPIRNYANLNITSTEWNNIVQCMIVYGWNAYFTLLNGITERSIKILKHSPFLYIRPYPDNSDESNIIEGSNVLIWWFNVRKIPNVFSMKNTHLDAVRVYNINCNIGARVNQGEIKYGGGIKGSIQEVTIDGKKAMVGLSLIHI